MLLFWPWAQTDPLENPLRALAFFSHQTFPFSTLFAGRFVPASDLPLAGTPGVHAQVLAAILRIEGMEPGPDANVFVGSRAIGGPDDPAARKADGTEMA